MYKRGLKVKSKRGGKKTLMKSRMRSKKRTYIPRGVTIRSSALPIAPVYHCKFKYSESVNLSVGSPGIPFEYTFRANSLYDPNASGAGGQPYYRDQLVSQVDGTSGLYQRYLVTASKIKVTFYQRPSGTGTTTPTQVYVYPANAQSSGLPTSFPDLDELRYIKRGSLQAAGAGDRQITTIKHYLPIHKFEGITKREFYDRMDDYQATGGGNPSLVPVWDIILLALTSGTGSVIADVKITYYTTLSDPTINIPAS